MSAPRRIGPCIGGCGRAGGELVTEDNAGHHLVVFACPHCGWAISLQDADKHDAGHDRARGRALRRWRRQWNAVVARHAVRR